MPLPVETGGGRLNVGGVTVIVSAGFTRPSDATQYTANDVVSNSTAATSILVFNDCVRFPGGSGILYSALMLDSVSGATKPSFDLFLFDTPTVTLAADNAAGSVTDAELSSCVGVITFNGANAANVSVPGPNSIIGATALGQAFKCAQGFRNLYGMVVDRAGYTPSSAEQFFFKLAILQD